ncbi:3'-5' exonuclease [soil metagenome]
MTKESFDPQPDPAPELTPERPQERPPVRTRTPEAMPAPGKEDIALLPPFDGLGLDRIELIATAPQAERAIEALQSATMLGFDTESKPTFAKGEVSDGPHIVQLSTLERAYVFQLHDLACRELLAGFLASHPSLKVGFGLGDDKRRILIKLGVEATGVVDLNAIFRRLGYRKDIGVKAAVAILFGKRFAKSGRASTSNWASRRLADSQLLYAANDAYAAARVYEALGPRAVAT